MPTPETVSLRYFLDMMVALRKPIMLIGAAGVVRAEHLTPCVRAGARVLPADRCMPCSPEPQGKTQLVKASLQALPEDTMALSVSMN